MLIFKIFTQFFHIICNENVFNSKNAKHKLWRTPLYNQDGILHDAVISMTSIMVYKYINWCFDVLNHLVASHGMKCNRTSFCLLCSRQRVMSKEIKFEEKKKSQQQTVWSESTVNYFIPPSSSAVGVFSTYCRCFWCDTCWSNARSLSSHERKCARALSEVKRVVFSYI